MIGIKFWLHRSTFVGLLLLTGGCASSPTSGPASASAPAVSPKVIGMEVKSWGRPAFQWQVDGEGSGTFIEAAQVPGGAFGDYDLLSRPISAGRSGYAKLDSILQPAARYAGKPLPCASRATDLPYGSVTWREGESTRTLTFDSGCDHAGAEEAYKALSLARDLVRGWVKDAPATKLQEVRSSNR
jgi:hypothetical protein